MIEKLRVGTVLGAFAVLGFGAALAGCGFGPGDYRIYQVAVGSQSRSSGCFFPGTGPDPNTQFDTTDAIGTQQWILTAGPNEEFYLESNLGALKGVATDDGYHFSLFTVDVDFAGNVITGTKTTDTTDVDLNVTVDGNTINGTLVNTSTHECAGAGCPNPPVPACTTTTNFTGSEIDDVKLEHDPA